jgi:hypothetical protein
MKIGDIVRIASQWLNPNENPNRLYIVVEVKGNGRVSIRATDCDYMVVPVETVSENMLRVIGNINE